MSPLRVTHLSHNDQQGGGPLACYRLHRALLELDIDSKMLVLARHRDEATIVDAPLGWLKTPMRLADRVPLRLYPGRMHDRIWSPGRFGIDGLERHARIAESDVIGLYWVNGGFLSIAGIGRLLVLGKPVIWRLSDLWPFTGGCHHPGDCRGFEGECGTCPQLGSVHAGDLSARQLKMKKRWSTDQLTVVAPSQWIRELAANSALFHDVPLKHITTGVDVTAFRPGAQDQARQKMDLPQDRRLILFGAHNAIGNARKGFSHLIDALDQLVKDQRLVDVDLVLFGSEQAPALPLDLTVHNVGVLKEPAALAMLYRAVDLFVTPSLEDNLPNTVIEALASGTPAVAFSVGGTGELIEHGVSGYLAAPGDSHDLARGIESILEAADSAATMGRKAREAMVARHDQRVIARTYRDLYEEVTANAA